MLLQFVSLHSWAAMNVQFIHCNLLLYMGNNNHLTKSLQFVVNMTFQWHNITLTDQCETGKISLDVYFLIEWIFHRIPTLLLSPFMAVSFLKIDIMKLKDDYILITMYTFLLSKYIAKYIYQHFVLSFTWNAVFQRCKYLPLWRFLFKH